jgi:hypothetical protein
MGIVIKYQLEFPEAGLRVSNDLSAGDFLLDANIKIKMERGRAGTSFVVQLFDLPLARAQELNKLLRRSGRAHVSVRLGYFDGAFEPVLEGVFTSVHSAVSQSGEQLVTTIEGLEVGAYLLANTELQHSLPQDKSVGEIVDFVLKQATLAQYEIDRQAMIENVPATLKDKALRGRNVLGLFDELAEVAQADLLVRDKKVWFGKPVKDDSYLPAIFEPDVNLASFEPFTTDIPAEADANLLNPLEATRAEGFRFIVTGDPLLRPAQRVAASSGGFDELADAEYRIQSLSHEFSMSAGYLCRGTAMRVHPDANSRRRASAVNRSTAASFVDTLAKKVQAERRQQPSVEIAKVRSYTPGSATAAEKHLSTLYFGHRFAREETQPSVRAEVESSEEQLYRHKPIASPFAWHLCGMVVPVYPGMKAVLNHNLDLQDDGIVSGFIWSQQPAIEPPRNKEGDWWLCLPIDFDTTQPPTAETLAVNDLTANNGKRVIEVKGLKITVGAGTLPTVGTRPEEGADDEFLIEHVKGTKITIDRDGVVKIEAGQGLKISGDVSLDGNLSVSGNLDVRDGNVTIDGNVDIL